MDRQLVVRAQAGDHAAFAALAGASIGRLTAIARLTLRDGSRAEDAVQEALVGAWRNIRSLHDPERFDAWLYRLLTLIWAASQTMAPGMTFDQWLAAFHQVAVDGTTKDATHDAVEAQASGPTSGDLRLEPSCWDP